MMLTTDDFCRKIIASECKPNFKFVKKPMSEPQFGLTVILSDEIYRERVVSNWNKFSSAPNTIDPVFIGPLLVLGVNVPREDGYLPMPQYVIDVRNGEIASAPLQLVMMAAHTYREIIAQADAFKGCPREELAHSVTHSLVPIAKELQGHHEIYIHIDEDLRGYIVKMDKFSLCVDCRSLIFTFHIGDYKTRTVHSLNPILTDLFGLKND